MNYRTSAKALFLIVSATLLACGDPLVAPELIVNTRILAARTEGADDTSRAWVIPSETASIRWLIAGPNGPVSLGWTSSACVAESVSRGLPICAAAPFAEASSSDVSTIEPRFYLQIPDAGTLENTPQIAVNAAFCASGAPILGASGVDFTTTTCPDTSETPLYATTTVQATLDGVTNANPDFNRVTLRFDGVDWPVWSEADAAPGGCTDQEPSIPHLSAGGVDHEIQFSVPANMSEPLAQISVHSAARETLSLAHFVTAGDLERAYSDVDVQTDPALVHVHWKTPATVDASGELVRFYVVLRDGRGGTDFSERAVCVTP